MKKISVVYATMTKHSRKIADAVAGALGVTALNVADSPKIGQIDLLFIVGGLYSGESMPELLEAVSGLKGADVKSAALITSSVSDKRGQDGVRARLKDAGIPVADEYRCFGSFLFFKLGRPNKADVQGAVDFASRLAAKEA